MKTIYINETIHINEDAENIPNYFNCIPEEIARNAVHWITKGSLELFPQVVIKMIEDGRLDIVCSMAAVYMSNMVKTYNQ